MGPQGSGMEQLAKGLGKNIGWGMGLEFRESAYQLSASNETQVRAGMVFNVSLGVCLMNKQDVIPWASGCTAVHAHASHVCTSYTLWLWHQPQYMLGPFRYMIHGC